MTVAFAFSVKVQVFVLFPPLEQAQNSSAPARSSLTASAIIPEQHLPRRSRSLSGFDRQWRSNQAIAERLFIEYEQKAVEGAMGRRVVAPANSASVARVSREHQIEPASAHA